MSIIYTDDKGKPIRATLLSQRNLNNNNNNKLTEGSTNNTTLIIPQSQQQQQLQNIPQSYSPNKAINNNNNNSNDIYSSTNTDLITLNTPGYRQQQQQQLLLQQQNRFNSLQSRQQQQQQLKHQQPLIQNTIGMATDLDRMSLGSINIPEDISTKIRRTSVNNMSTTETNNQIASQRRTSFLRKHWQQHSDVPFVIGADPTTSSDGACERILTGFSWVLMILFLPWSLFFTLKVVQEYERAVIFRLGRLLPGGAKGPGMFLVLPCIETYTKVDMRTVSFDVPPQEVLTKDSVTVAVDAVVYYRVFNPVISIANVENAQESTRLLAQTSLRNVLGTNSLSEILSNREAVSLCMREILDEATDHWGIKVERVEIKDVRLPIQLQRAMAAEAEATREARAKVIAAEGEHKASRALKDAADILSESSGAIQLRYLQTLNNIAGEKNSTIIFPLPIEIFSGFLNRSSNNKREQQSIASVKQHKTSDNVTDL